MRKVGKGGRFYCVRRRGLVQPPKLLHPRWRLDNRTGQYLYVLMSSDPTDIPLGGLVNTKGQVNLSNSGRLGKARCNSATVTQL